ncbi:MAG: hypothetical protein ACTSYB_16340 [Candidatus Helarchaeota archaeon]
MAAPTKISPFLLRIPNHSAAAGALSHPHPHSALSIRHFLLPTPMHCP